MGHCEVRDGDAGILRARRRDPAPPISSGHRRCLAMERRAGFSDALRPHHVCPGRSQQGGDVDERGWVDSRGQYSEWTRTESVETRTESVKCVTWRETRWRWRKKHGKPVKARSLVKQGRDSENRYHWKDKEKQQSRRRNLLRAEQGRDSENLKDEGE